MKLQRPSLLLILILASVALLPLLAYSRRLPAVGAITAESTAGNPANPRQPRAANGANTTVGAGTRKKGGHPNKGHHRHPGNATAVGATKPNGNGNGAAKGSQTSPNPKTVKPTSPNPKTVKPTSPNPKTVKPSPPNPKTTNPKNGNPKSGSSGAAQPNKSNGKTAGGATRPNVPRRPKQIAEDNCGSKTSWPEVVGKTGENARQYILASMPQCNWEIRIIPAGGFATMDYRTDRIRIYVDKQGIVRTPPKVG